MKRGFYLLLAALSLVGCSKDVNSDDLKDDVPYYQYYEVGYDKNGNSTVAAAHFRVRDKDGTKVELTNGASVRVNGMASGTSSIDKTRYTWTLTGMPDVNFVLTKNSGTTVTNNILRNDIDDIDFPSSFPVAIDKTVGFSFSWTGSALSSSETLTVSIVHNGYEYVTKSVTENPVVITANELKDCPTGEISVALHRAKSMPVKTEDGNAGGVVQLRVSVSTNATLN